MIDIHCHILPGIDDGPLTLNESIEMCRMASTDGIKTIVATPHFNPGAYENSSDKIFRLIEDLETELKNNKIGIKILPGADIAVTPELTDYFKKEEYLTINKNNKYFLAEFPPASVPPMWDKFLLALMDSGMVPIITHPERNMWFMEHPDALYSVVSKGVLVQITAMSITGSFGEDIQRYSIFLLQNNLAHVIATDAHSAVYRPPLLADAVKMASDVIGKEKAESLVTTIPSAIIEGRPIFLPEPVQPRKYPKGWLQKIFF